MGFNQNIIGSNSKEDIIKIINSDRFKNLFLKNEINNVIIFGSLTTNNFNEESDIDIAVISDKKIDFSLDLKISLELEEMLGRSIDLKDENIDNTIKIEALNSDFIVMKDDEYIREFEKYDRLYKENKEFWSRLDKVVLENK